MAGVRGGLAYRMSGTKPVVGVTRRLPGEVAVAGAEVRLGGEAAMPRAELLAFVRGASGVITWVSERVDAEVLEVAGDGLRVVANYAVGYDNIDVAACRARGVAVTNTPNAVTEGTANVAIMLMLAAGRRLIEGDRFARTGAWAERGVLGPDDFMGVSFAGGLFLVVGAGRIGYATALRARAFGMRVAYVARSAHLEFEMSPIAAERVSLEEGLRAADVVSVHCPLTDETRGLIGERELALMKPTAVLVNTARGPVVDEAALASAVRGGRLFGAGLDVFEREPAVHPDLAGQERVVMTPHIGSAEGRWRREMTRMACANVEAVLAGREPPNRVG